MTSPESAARRTLCVRRPIIFNKAQHLQHLLQMLMLRFILQALIINRLCDMPKCEVDLVLQEQLRLFMSDNRLSVNGAAEKLGVGRTTLWRFYHSGRARTDTRVLYQEALAKCSNDAVGNVADVADVADSNPGSVRRAPRAGLADLDLKRIRRACETILALLDICEAQALGRKI